MGQEIRDKEQGTRNKGKTLSFRVRTQFFIGQKEGNDMKLLFLHLCVQFDRLRE